MSRPVILTFVRYYLPGQKSGGPVRTIANMVDRLGDELDFRIVTADRDCLDTEPYPDVLIDDWNTVGKATVFYASPRNRSMWRLAQLISKTPHDILYLNSFFHTVFTLRPLLARSLALIPKHPIVLAPRGEFSEGALALKSWEKRTYIPSMKLLGPYREITWQASSEYEAEDIRRVMGAVAKRIAVAPDLPAVPDATVGGEQETSRAHCGSFRVCFLSRISPMKNLDYALKVLAEVKVPVEFHVYGMIDDEPYWQLCEELIKLLPSHVVVRCHGAVDHVNVAQTLAKHNLFFLPTRGENYGHVIFEALSSGLPVLLSDQTPWRNLEANGVGWDLPLSAPERFRAVIEAQAYLDDETWVAQRYRTRQYAERVARDEKVYSSNLTLFTDLVARRQTKQSSA